MMPSSGATIGTPRNERMSGWPPGHQPRKLRDTLGPLAAFYVLWKTVGLAAGVLGALAVGLVALYFARREGRPGAFVRVVLAIVLFRAAVGLIGHSTTLYLAQDATIDIVLGSVFLGSLALGK